MDTIYAQADFISNILTIIVSLIAIYLFLAKRETISKAIKLLLTYSNQITLTELRFKLERLNDLRTEEDSHKDEIKNLFHDIAGQIKGNPKLKNRCLGLQRKINAFTDNPNKFTEPHKRSLVSEIREILRAADVENMDDLIGGSNE